MLSTEGEGRENIGIEVLVRRKRASGGAEF